MVDIGVLVVYVLVVGSLASMLLAIGLLATPPA